MVARASTTQAHLVLFTTKTSLTNRCCSRTSSCSLGKVTSGFYVNIIFTAKPDSLKALQSKLSLNNDIYRTMINHAPVVVAKPTVAA